MKLSFGSLTALTILASSIGFAAPASATDGLHAIGMCYNSPGCIVAMNDGVDIDIVTAGGTLIHCDTLESECTAPPPPPDPHPPSRLLPGKHLNAAQFSGRS